MKTINRNGLKFELNEDETETGKVVGIEVDLPANELINFPHSRKIELLSLVEEIDLNMIIQSRINYYTEDGTKLMSEAIDLEDISEEAKNFKKRLFRSYTLAPKSTRDSFVDSSNGNIVTEDTEGAISELIYYQNLAKVNLEQINPDLAEEDRLQYLRYYMLAYMLYTLFERTGI